LTLNDTDILLAVASGGRLAGYGTLTASGRVRSIRRSGVAGVHTQTAVGDRNDESAHGDLTLHARLAGAQPYQERTLDLCPCSMRSDSSRRPK